MVTPVPIDFTGQPTLLPRIELWVGLSHRVGDNFCAAVSLLCYLAGVFCSIVLVLTVAPTLSLRNNLQVQKDQRHFNNLHDLWF